MVRLLAVATALAWTLGSAPATRRHSELRVFYRSAAELERVIRELRAQR